MITCLQTTLKLHKPKEKQKVNLQNLFCTLVKMEGESTFPLEEGEMFLVQD